jgi:hypothetical protein
MIAIGTYSTPRAKPALGRAQGGVLGEQASRDPERVRDAEQRQGAGQYRRANREQ